MDNNLNNDGMAGVADRMRHSLAMQSESYDQPLLPCNQVRAEAHAKRMRHLRAMQAQAYEQVAAADSQP